MYQVYDETAVEYRVDSDLLDWTCSFVGRQIMTSSTLERFAKVEEIKFASSSHTKEVKKLLVYGKRLPLSYYLEETIMVTENLMM